MGDGLIRWFKLRPLSARSRLLLRMLESASYYLDERIVFLYCSRLMLRSDGGENGASYRLPRC